MNFEKYLIQQGGTATPTCSVIGSLAKKAGCSCQWLYMVVKGHKQAGPKAAILIENVTNGAVSRSDLRPDLWPPSMAAA